MGGRRRNRSRCDFYSGDLYGGDLFSGDATSGNSSRGVFLVGGEIFRETDFLLEGELLGAEALVIAIRTPEEIEKIRVASRMVAEAHERIKESIEPGVSTQDLDDLVRDCVLSRGGTLLFFNYRGFPANSCISINEEVVHGIPRKRRKLKEGDIVSVDIGVRYKGYCGDSAWTHRVGQVSEEVEGLLRVGEESLRRGIEACRDGARVSDIGKAIQSYVESSGYYVVKQFVGHGIGTELHEDPQVPNYVDTGLFKRDPVLKEGMVLAIEPMVNVGTEEVLTLDDGWTVVTADRRPSVHFEHTVAITGRGPEPLTVPIGPLPETVEAQG